MTDDLTGSGVAVGRPSCWGHMAATEGRDAKRNGSGGHGQTGGGRATPAVSSSAASRRDRRPQDAVPAR